MGKDRYRPNRNGAILLVTLVLAGMAASGCSRKPGGAFPSGPSPQDALVIRLVRDQSCDRRSESEAEVAALTDALVTQAAFHAGSFGEAAVRSDAIEHLEFREVRFL